MKSKSATSAWIHLLADIASAGERYSPRGIGTLEIIQKTIAVNMRYPVVLIPERKLSYQFMAAEAYWILSGDDRVETIAPFNKHISKFSDDGDRFFGAYGPKVMAQTEYVVTKLVEDRDSRQAGLTIWRQNPPQTKDYPCTIAMFFYIRDGKLNCNVFMRSSDAWLGVPYDIFNFSMIAHYVCARLNINGVVVSPGDLYLTMASSHMYESDEQKVADIFRCSDITEAYETNETPDFLFVSSHIMKKTMDVLRFTKPGDPHRWWES